MSVGAFIRRVMGVRRGADDVGDEAADSRILIVGSPNVGKSMLFNRLTGRYVTVSNYPGTTIEVSRGRSRVLGGKFEVVDTPGMYSLSGITDEERVACEMLLRARPKALLHVVDAKNLERMLGLTLQLIEAGLPVVLVLNMADEARELGIRLDVKELEQMLGVPVVETVATTGEGMGELAMRIGQVAPAERLRIDYGPVIEEAIDEVSGLLPPSEAMSARSRALLLLQDETEAEDELAAHLDNGRMEDIRRIADAARRELDHSLHYYVTVAARREVEEILGETATFPARERTSWREKLSRLCMHPVTGIPILLVVLYFGLYKFVGGFGAGVVVDWIEGTIFEQYVNPWVEQAVAWLIPWQVIRDLFAGDYGVFTLGLRYAVAIVLPIVGTFFLAFSLLEDSGYLPRLAMLIDRMFKRIGLNGRAVIPIVLGFGCDTMATMVTRTLETRREKIISSFLLALAIPCSAQLGVILGLLSGHPLALLAWAGFVGCTFLLSGLLAAKILPGPRPSFYMELPPLRLPKITNVLVKTYSRMVWYFKEVIPLFMLASVFIWIGEVTGLFQLAVRVLEPAVRLLGLPDEAAVAFLFGFFRRDYGAAGLFDLQQAGLLNGAQLAVAAITLTLFLPCVAQFLILKKERGWKLTLMSAGIILLVAFAAGLIAHVLFELTGAVL